MRDSKLYIQDIIESIEKILEYTRGMDSEDFVENGMAYDAVIRNFEIIGEAARNIPEDITSEHTEIPWADMVGMRNILIHGYLGIDDSIVWNTVRLLPNYLNKLTVIKDDF
jgi:uncharacterized protein with HEPN domain